jgi:hypothetical protein
VKRLYAWLAGVVGGAAVYRAFRRHPPAASVAVPDPAAELKAKLAETRAATEDAPAPAAAAPAVDADVDARRRAVHDRARATIDEMHESDPS